MTNFLMRTMIVVAAFSAPNATTQPAPPEDPPQNIRADVWLLIHELCEENPEACIDAGIEE